MTIIESLVRLRDDLKKWATNNLLFLDRRTQNIEDDGSGALNITDEKGNLILRVDKDGIKTTAVDAKAITVNGEDVSTLGSSMENIEDDGSAELTVRDPDGNVIMRVDEGGVETTEVTAERVSDRGGEDLTVTDPDGNVIFRVDEDGLETTVVKAQRLVVNGVDVGEQEPPVTDYNDLENAPDIEDDESGELTVQDSKGNPIMRVDEFGLETTRVVAGGVDLGAAVENIGDVFWAVYGETAYEELVAAHNSGAVVKCVYGGREYSYSTYFGIKWSEEYTYYFVLQAPSGSTGAMQIQCVLENGVSTWTEPDSFVFEKQDNKVTEITEESTDTEYPSAKAVHTAILAQGGVFIAVYGETSLTDIFDARDAGKAIFCCFDDGTSFAPLSSITEDLDDAIFVAVFTHPSAELECREDATTLDSVWSRTDKSAQQAFETDETLDLTDGVLKVNMATEVGDQTLPVTAAAVNTAVGNIEILLETI